MDKSFIWAWFFKNIIAILAWVALAILFNKWWIALFALLFVSGIETKFKSYRVCDGCGKHSPYANSYNEALDKAKEAGWIHYVDGNRDYCPECSKNVKYIWMTIADGSNIKIYKQKKKVAYADYRSGMFYISPHECIIQN